MSLIRFRSPLGQSGGGVGVPQGGDLSSQPPLQSLSVSHSHFFLIQFPSGHLTSSFLHVGGGVVGQCLSQIHVGQQASGYCFQ